jgi:hypothetical protein
VRDKRIRVIRAKPRESFCRKSHAIPNLHLGATKLFRSRTAAKYQMFTLQRLQVAHRPSSKDEPGSQEALNSRLLALDCHLLEPAPLLVLVEHRRN